MNPIEKVCVARLPAISVLIFENVEKTTLGVSPLALYLKTPARYKVVDSTESRKLIAESTEYGENLLPRRAAELEPLEAKKRDFRPFGKEYLKNYRK